MVQVRKLLSKYKAMGYRHIVPFPNYSTSPEEYKSIVKDTCRRTMAHAIVDLLEDTAAVKVEQVPQGEEYSIQGYFLTYKQLLEVANEAYTQGMKDANFKNCPF